MTRGLLDRLDCGALTGQATAALGEGGRIAKACRMWACWPDRWCPSASRRCTSASGEPERVASQIEGERPSRSFRPGLKALEIRDQVPCRGIRTSGRLDASKQTRRNRRNQGWKETEASSEPDASVVRWIDQCWWTMRVIAPVSSLTSRKSPLSPRTQCVPAAGSFRCSVFQCSTT